MKLTINGNEEDIQEEKTTITGLLKIKNVEMPDMVSVELNGEILDKENFEKTLLNEGDKVEFLYFMGGGSGFAAEQIEQIDQLDQIEKYSICGQPALTVHILISGGN